MFGVVGGGIVSENVVISVFLDHRRLQHFKQSLNVLTTSTSALQHPN